MWAALAVVRSWSLGKSVGHLNVEILGVGRNHKKPLGRASQGPGHLGGPGLEAPCPERFERVENPGYRESMA